VYGRFCAGFPRRVGIRIYLGTWYLELTLSSSFSGSVRCHVEGDQHRRGPPGDAVQGAPSGSGAAEDPVKVDLSGKSCSCLPSPIHLIHSMCIVDSLRVRSERLP
jgi:hypothetical protein